MMNEIDGFEVFNERVLESKTQKVELAFGFGLRIFRFELRCNLVLSFQFFKFQGSHKSFG
jgi:hypothetical protein